jgi:hypothetical protein
MAIYHLNAKTIARSKGKSATAAAAYRAGEKIEDRRTGVTHDYTRRKGVYATEIIAPERSPHWAKDRAELWNQAELVETRVNSRTAREFDIALPVELSHQAKRKLVRSFVTDQFTQRNLVADIAFHDINSQNPHVHILITTRAVTEEGFQEKVRELDSKDFLLQLRQTWAERANIALEKAGSTERIDHRTLLEQGIERIPQIHKGSYVSAMMDKGMKTERGDRYSAIESANQQIKSIEAQKADLERLIALESPEPPQKLSHDSTQRQDPQTRGVAADLTEVIDRLASSNQRVRELGERLSHISRDTREIRSEAATPNRDATNLNPTIPTPSRPAKRTQRKTKPDRDAEKKPTERHQHSKKAGSLKNRGKRDTAISKVDGEPARADISHSTDDQHNLVGTQPDLPPQPPTTSGHQKQAQQHRDSSETHRERNEPDEAHQQETSTPQKTEPEPITEEQVLALARTALAAVERYGQKRDRGKILTNATHKIEREYVFEDRAWHTYLTIADKDSQKNILTLRSDNLEVRQMSLITNHLTQQDVDTFSNIQTTLDQLQRRKQLKEDAEKLLHRSGTRSGNYSNRSRELKLDSYDVITDNKSLRIIAKDGRDEPEILNYPHYADRSYPEVEAKVGFTREDAEFFRTIVKSLEERQRQAELGKERPREQDRGFGR